jgi:hypothetical protein
MGYPHKLYMGRFRSAFLIHLITFRGISTTVVTISLSWTHRSGLFFCIQMRHGFIIQKNAVSSWVVYVHECSRTFQNKIAPGSMSPGSLPSYTSNISMFIWKACKKTQGESAGRPKKLSGNAVGDVIRLQRSSEFQWWAHIMIIIIINMIID